jgi:methylthioribose-1-phosphate isomerase
MKNDPIYWEGDVTQGKAVIIEQTKLPLVRQLLEIHSAEEMWDAIRKLKIRGAPAIGIAAAYGVVLGIRGEKLTLVADFMARLRQVCDYLASSRPTAVNLFWALRRMQDTAARHAESGVAAIKQILLAEAHEILAEDRRRCAAIGEYGQVLLLDGMRVITHCNAGGLATSGYGTALGVIFSAVSQGKKVHVYADETRPLWQGARLTTWELKEAGIPVTLICDNTAAFVMQQKKVDIAIVGADRIARNGDVANKIGTYSLAVVAKAHGVPFYVAAPLSTFDPSIHSGDAIPIEERGAEEVTAPTGVPIAPPGIQVYAPAFDVTPACYITGIITERGILRPPFQEAIGKLFSA